ncbi:MAG: preprotein translocase subunit SecG [Holosporales bacterium]|jgi:preprotein translocase subunit SecG|nr:preprotein translocase subunit SecG [Holosporales bacterium]
MLTFLLSLHFVITIALVTIILLQKSEGGAWGMGGGAGGVLTPRWQANLLTRATTILASLFIVNCLIMAAYIHHHADPRRSLIDEAAQGVTSPSSTPTPAEPLTSEDTKNSSKEKAGTRHSSIEETAQGTAPSPSSPVPAPPPSLKGTKDLSEEKADTQHSAIDEETSTKSPPLKRKKKSSKKKST